MEPGFFGIGHAHCYATFQQVFENLLISEPLALVDDSLHIRSGLLLVLSRDFVLDLRNCEIFVNFNFELSIIVHLLRKHKCDLDSLDVDDTL